MPLTYTKILLVGLALYGFWTLWGFPYKNGLLRFLANQTKPGALIPGPTAAPMRRVYTGIKPFDRQLSVLVSFFFTATDGNRADVSLQFLDLGGQVLAAWTLITIESLRVGNGGNLFLTSTTVFGILVALIGFACVAPLWYALHLATAATVINPTDHELLIASPLQLAIAPLSMLIGFGIPSVVMSLAAPARLSFDMKQLWTGIQQGWPIWIAIAQIALTVLVSVMTPSRVVMKGDEQTIKTRKYLRQAYAFALVSSAGPHLTAWGISLLAYAFPVLFTQPYFAQLQPSNVFGPVNPFSTIQAQTLADGALWFLQWDLIIGTAATLVWALAINHTALKSGRSIGQTALVLVQAAILSFLVGPSGAAVVAMWSRDELIFKRSARADTALAKKKSK